MFCLERAEPYIVKTELTKNRTHQNIRWKQLLLCEDKEILIQRMKDNQRVINWDNLEVVAKGRLLY